MPRALNEFEKRDRLIEKAAEREAVATAPVAAVDGTTRKKRNVFNGTEAKISVQSQIPGYHLHVFTDAGGRIQAAMDSGYEFVRPDEVGGVSENVVSRNGDLGERIRFLVNPRAEGTEQYGYLMKIRQEWFEEDQAELQNKNNLIDAAIRKGKITGSNSSFYTPRDGIKVTS
ncbi:hypothetical protein UFOVP135_37 [uncultured Caudovirales phage]|uniref:Uncharacterized protein n=1 Tax=uncultured Caudovirales phage TaxID=2100421 RepID=A0A6J5LFU2_9CAUD|nr:hypothetical protein UFOVP135_37 [uncultured Caudovirales phage]